MFYFWVIKKKKKKSRWDLSCSWWLNRKWFINININICCFLGNKSNICCFGNTKATFVVLATKATCVAFATRYWSWWIRGSSGWLILRVSEFLRMSDPGEIGIPQDESSWGNWNFSGWVILGVWSKDSQDDWSWGSKDSQDDWSWGSRGSSGWLILGV